jgi:4-azaleucine resistance transporter AzlC
MSASVLASPSPTQADRSAARELWSGVRDLAPLLLGVAPYGLVYGVLALASGIEARTAMAMSVVVFAGASQFLLAQLVAGGALPFVMVAAVALVNLRHTLYSASLAPHVTHLPLRWKVALSYVLTDESYAVSMRRLERGQASPNRHWYLLGVGATLWLGWQLATAAGLVLGGQLPSSLPLDFALPLTFIAIVVPMIRSRAAVATALASAGVALAAAAWPYKLGMMAASLAGILAGALAAPGRDR